MDNDAGAATIKVMRQNRLMEDLDLAYFEDLLGTWEIRYPRANGLIREDYVERLELMDDGTFSWTPAPLWAKSGGRYGITQEAGRMRLYFEQRQRSVLRGNYLVIIEFPSEDGTELTFHWQRTRHDGVVFSDRILMGRRPKPDRR